MDQSAVLHFDGRIFEVPVNRRYTRAGITSEFAWEVIGRLNSNKTITEMDPISWTGLVRN